MRGNRIPMVAVAILSGFFISLGASAEVFKWVDDKGTVHFTEEESDIPERYRNQAEKRSPLEESGPSIQKKVEPDKPKKKGPTKPSAKEPVEKQGTNVRRIESDVSDCFQNIISLWNDKKYDALYDCGDRKSRTGMAKEDFEKKMKGKAWELASSWEKVRDVEVDVKSATHAYVTAKMGYRPKRGGNSRIQTQTYEMRLENGIWKINLTKMLNAPGK
jgi:hypothetical protein